MNQVGSIMAVFQNVASCTQVLARLSWGICGGNSTKDLWEPVSGLVLNLQEILGLEKSRPYGFLAGANDYGELETAARYVIITDGQKALHFDTLTAAQKNVYRILGTVAAVYHHCFDEAQVREVLAFQLHWNPSTGALEHKFQSSPVVCRESTPAEALRTAKPVTPQNMIRIFGLDQPQH